MEYAALVDVYDKLFAASKRLEKTRILAQFLKDQKAVQPHLFHMIRGRVFPDWDETNIGFAARTAVKAISIASGISLSQIEHLWKEHGDLGIAAEHAMTKKRQSTLFTQSLNVDKVYANLRKIAEQEGQGSVTNKVRLVTELLSCADSRQAKYIIRTLLEDMRIGIGDSTIRDSIIWTCFDVVDITEKDATIADRETYTKIQERVQEAYDITNDWSEVFSKAREGISHLETIKLKVGRPVKVMLFPKAVDIEDAFNRVGKPCAFEYKYDGFRVEIHKQGETVTLYTRRLDNVTAQFPDVVEVVKTFVSAEACILDAEIIGIASDKSYIPFQEISQRIKRKHGIEDMAKNLPVELNIFDILYHDTPCLKIPFSKRRAILEKIVTCKKGKIMLAEQIITDDEKEVQAFFEKSIALSNEGLMAKSLDAEYRPGARVGYGVKLKVVKESLDLVIVKAEHGEGKRAGWFTSFTVACMDEEGDLLEIGKVSTGLKEKDEEGVSFKRLTELLKPLILTENGKTVIVKPRIIIEVGHEEIQKSSSYASGYALRFPRFLKLRDDKPLDEVTTIDYIEKLYKEQI